VKLCPPEDKPIDTVIINGCECESFLTCDYRLMLEETRDLIDGTMLIMKTVGAKNAYIAVEDNKPKAIELLQKELEGKAGIKVAALPTKYPEGAEKMLINVITGREVPSGCLPMEVGSLVQNVGTTIAISKAVRQGTPLIERVITVAGSGMKEPNNIRVKIGTPIEHIINNCGGFSEEPDKIIVGGPMTGFAQFDLRVPIVKGTSGILALTTDEISLNPLNQTACIRCARCVDHCPVHLMPNYFAIYGDLDDWDTVESFNVMDCVECGTCSFVCPARIPHIQYVRLGKCKVLAKAKK
jgi:electron transport complex protein RnfC